MSNSDMSSLVEPGFVRFTSRYLRRLIVEAPYIYERLYNPSGSIILQQYAGTPEYTNRYSTMIGNTFHNDLIDAAIILQREFSKDERRLLYDWAFGMNAYQAAEYYGVTGDVVRKRRSRAVAKLRKALDEQQGTGTGSDGDTEGRREGSQYHPVQDGDTGRAPSVHGEQAGDTHEQGA